VRTSTNKKKAEHRGQMKTQHSTAEEKKSRERKKE
jgi:hypothetical protein